VHDTLKVDTCLTMKRFCFNFFVVPSFKLFKLYFVAFSWPKLKRACGAFFNVI